MEAWEPGTGREQGLHQAAGLPDAFAASTRLVLHEERLCAFGERAECLTDYPLAVCAAKAFAGLLRPQPHARVRFEVRREALTKRV